jgi:hypothetical protein
MNKRLAIVAALAVVTSAVSVQAEDEWGMPGVEYGAPLRWSGYAGYSWDRRDSGLSRGIRLSLGEGGGKLTFGVEKRMGKKEFAPLASASAVLARTWGDTLQAAPGATYVGGEASVRVPLVARMSVGVWQRIAGNPQAKALMVTWSLGVDVSAPLVAFVALFWRGPLIGHIEV